MLHWWTSGGEAAALNVIKQALAKEGYAWKDVPVAGGGGGAAMTTLKAMVAAGNPPTASQILGYYAIDYAEAGKLADITPLATKGDWAKVVPTALQKFTTHRRQMGRRSGQHPFRQLDLDQQGRDGQDRRDRAEDLRRIRRAARQGQGGRRHPARARRPALAGSDDVRLVVASTGGIDFYKKAFIDLDESALKSDTMKKAFDNLAKLRDYLDPNYAGRDWNLATAMVIKGDALVQVMGDWAKGEFKRRQQGSRQGLPLLPLPRHRRLGALQHRHVRLLPGLRGPQGGAARARRGDDEPGRPDRRSTSSRDRCRRAWTFPTRPSTPAARRASPTSRRPTRRARSSARWRRTTPSRRRSRRPITTS